MAKKLVREAAQEYLDRQNRIAHPVGMFDNAGRWYPANGYERRVCCKSIHQPSRKYPLSLNRHCRSVQHIAYLFGVDPKEVRAYLNSK